ncbi:hypothetical protein [Methanopyrus sp.]
MFRILLRRGSGAWEDRVEGEPPPEARRIATAFLDRFIRRRLTFDLRPHATLVYRRHLLLAAVLLVEVEPETVVRAVELGLEPVGSGEVPTVVARDPPDRYPLDRLMSLGFRYRSTPLPDGSLLGEGWAVYGAATAAEAEGDEEVDRAVREARERRVHLQWNAFDRCWEVL